VQLASIGCECDTDSQFVRKKEIKGGKREEKKKVQRSLEKRKTGGGEGKKK